MSDNPWYQPTHEDVPVVDPLHTEAQHQQDKVHLTALAVLYYVSAGLCALWTLPTMLWGFWMKFAYSVSTDAYSGDPRDIDTFLLGYGGIVLGGVVYTILAICTGVCIGRRQNMTLIQVVAAFTCLSVPLGTGLGVFTFLVLNRPTVRELFDPGWVSRQREIGR